jgi:hypothetical protein
MDELSPASIAVKMKEDDVQKRNTIRTTPLGILNFLKQSALVAENSTGTSRLPKHTEFFFTATCSQSSSLLNSGMAVSIFR